MFHFLSLFSSSSLFSTFLSFHVSFFSSFSFFFKAFTIINLLSTSFSFFSSSPFPFFHSWCILLFLFTLPIHNSNFQSLKSHLMSQLLFLRQTNDLTSSLQSPRHFLLKCAGNSSNAFVSTTFPIKVEQTSNFC